MASTRKVVIGSVLGGIALGLCIALALTRVETDTSTNEYCMSCHYHEEADLLWKQSPHYLNGSGVVTDCAACHLPPKEAGLNRYYMAKLTSGAKDIWAKVTRDKDEIDWQAKRQLAKATG